MDKVVSQRRILVVDDDSDIADLLCTVLQGRGFFPIRAADGDEALAHARAHRPELVLLDIMMPAQDGWLVCAKLKLVEPAPRIVIITALPEEDSSGFAAFLQADGLMHKPIDLQKLLQTIDRMLNAPHPLLEERMLPRVGEKHSGNVSAQKEPVKAE